MDEIIRICALLVRNDLNEVLSLRKVNTEYFILPGGKPINQETPEQTIIREIQEELGITIESDYLQFFGIFRDHAANELNKLVEAIVYSYDARWDYVISPLNEIVEIRWISQSDLRKDNVAPLMRNQIVPLLSAIGSNNKTSLES